jgi:uncharacterized protein YyaL (SSP411 family)
MESNIKAAINWLCESDIINKDPLQNSFGGINNGYLWKDKKYQYVYNEITGYAINTFIAIYQWLGKDEYLELAKEAAGYLINLQVKDDSAFENGGIAHSLIWPDLNRVNNYYSFDNAVILHGMASLYRITKNEKYLSACLQIAGFLLKMQKQDGSFYSYFDADKGLLTHEADEFFFDNGCLHIKNAIGLMYLNQISEDRRFAISGSAVCAWGARLQAADGLFWANTRKKYVFTHAHCYATEGYLYAYFLTNEPEYLKISRKAGDALLNLQNQDGSLYRIYKNNIFMRNQCGSRSRMSFRRWRNEKKMPWKTIDASSQAARIWILLYSLDHDTRYLDAAKKAIGFLKRNQVLNTNDRNMFGGLYYQLCDSTNGTRTTSDGMYTWCTQFSLSAFIMFTSVPNKKKLGDMIAFLY